MIVVVDYGMGNLRSVSKALEHLGAKVKVSSSSADIARADKVVVPGVGAFGDAARELERLGLKEPLREFVWNKKPFLGICLGLQLLFDESEESPGQKGLGLFPGRVRLFPSGEVKVPHMGWNSVHLRFAHPLLAGVREGSYFYFVHSYYADPAEASVTAASCTYGDRTFTAILGTGNVFATQFHPEKSQSAGLAILKNFIAWEPVR
ncbi:MAG: imidazole glycerol phosphate synthase subunit HisH [Candidatus Omnitrophota bacterium]|jgi:glutamine amidotransferase